MDRHREQQLFVQRKIQLVITMFSTYVFPQLFQIINSYYNRYYDKEPYHTSVLSGRAWVEELLDGHPERIKTELGLSKEAFIALRSELRAHGHTDSRNGVTLEEQMAIFLYTSVTGLSVRHVGERFQRANATITK
jgi:hypothetical protein